MPTKWIFDLLWNTASGSVWQNQILRTMKNTLLAVALVSLGIVSAEAAVIPSGAGFGANLANGPTDTISVGVPDVSFANLTLFNDSGSADDPSDSVGISPSTGANNFYKFRLEYRYTGASTVNSLRFSLFEAGTSAADALTRTQLNNNPSGDVFEGDIYNDPNTPGYVKQNINNLTGLIFVPRAATGASVFLSDLSLSGATSGSLPSSLSYVGDVNGATNFSFAATGLSDGFTLEGVFKFTSDSSSKGAGFDIFVAVPEPATICFGAALVGGLGLLEVRRRRQV